MFWCLFICRSYSTGAILFPTTLGQNGLSNSSRGSIEVLNWIGGSMERLKETTSCVRENSMAALGDALEAWNKRMQQVFSVPRSFCGGSELRKISPRKSLSSPWIQINVRRFPHPSMASFLNSSASAQAAMLRRGSQSSIDLAKEAQVVVCGVYPPQRERTQLTYATKGERMENHRLKVVPAPKWDIIC